MTINRALRELTGEGGWYECRAWGLLWRNSKATAMPEVRSIAEEIAVRGHHYRNHIVAVELMAASEELAGAWRAAVFLTDGSSG